MSEVVGWLGAAATVAFLVWLGLKFFRMGRLLWARHPAKRGRMLVVLVLMWVVPLAAAWALVTRHAAVGITLLILVFIVPNIFTVVLNVRRTRRR